MRFAGRGSIVAGLPGGALTKAVGRALATLRHISAVRLPPGMVFEAVTRCLAEITPFESATLVTYDENLEATDSFLTHELSPVIANRYFQRWFNREEARYIPSHARAAMGCTPDLIRLSDYQAQLWETELYDEVFRELGFYHMASLVLRKGGSAVGNISFGRPSGSSDFSAADLRGIREAATYTTLALSAAPLEDSVIESHSLDEIETALVLVDKTGAVQQLSPNAIRLLRWASLAHKYGPSVVKACLAEPTTGNESYAWSKPLLVELARRVEASLAGAPTEPPMMRRLSRHGEFVLRAYAMHSGTPGADTDVIAVEIQRRTPLDARLFRSDAFRALTSQEQGVARLLLKRLSQPEIAKEMGVSPHTVVSHVRNLYQRTGATSRETLHDALLGAPA